MKDHGPAPLLVLTANPRMRAVVETLLRLRQRDLEIAAPAYEVQRHPRSNPGCLGEVAEHVRPVLDDFGRLLVVFDYEGCGSDEAPAAVEKTVEADLARNGWKARSKVIVIVPGLESWIWSGSDGAAQALGWRLGYPALRNWLREQALWPSRAPRPPDPRKAAERVLGRNHRPITARFYRELAKTADFRDCRDPAFCALRDTLRDWYPAAPEPP